MLKLLSPRARKVEGLPRPAELLGQWAASEEAARRESVAALRAVLPTPALIAARRLDGLLLDPLSLGRFDAGGTGLGPTLMLGASWDAHKALAAPADEVTREASGPDGGGPDGGRRSAAS